jgi:hypothetical protein
MIRGEAARKAVSSHRTPKTLGSPCGALYEQAHPKRRAAGRQAHQPVIPRRRLGRRRCPGTLHYCRPGLGGPPPRRAAARARRGERGRCAGDTAPAGRPVPAPGPSCPGGAGGLLPGERAVVRGAVGAGGSARTRDKRDGAFLADGGGAALGRAAGRGAARAGRESRYRRTGPAREGAALSRDGGAGWRAVTAARGGRRGLA